MTGNSPIEPYRWPFAAMMFLLPLTSVCMQFFGFKRSYIFMGRFSSLISKICGLSHTPLTKAEQIARYVIVTNRRLSFYQARCLSESRLLWGLLRSLGFNAGFRLGVRTITGPLEAHAWVEFEGSVLNDIHYANRIYNTFDLSSITHEMEST